MLRGIGYVVARRDRDNAEEPHDWAIAIEAFLGRMIARCSVMFGRSLQPSEEDATACDLPERRHSRE